MKQVVIGYRGGSAKRRKYLYQWRVEELLESGKYSKKVSCRKLKSFPPAFDL